jgi:hypothetical protein
VWNAVGRGCGLALILAGVLLIGEAILSHVLRIGWSGHFTWQRILAIVVGGGAIAAGGVRVWQTWSGWPSTSARAHFRRRWTPFGVALAVYFVAFTIMGPFPEGDQPHYELESVGLAYYQSRDMTVDYSDPSFYLLMFPTGLQGEQAARYKPGGELVSGHNVGLPLLLAAAVPLVQEAAKLSWRHLWPWNIEIILIASLAALLLYRMLARLRPRNPTLVAAVWASVAFSPPMTVYASQIYPEMPAVLLALVAVDAFFRPPSRRSLLVGAGAASLMPWFHVRFLPITVVLVAGLAVRALASVPKERRFSRAAIGPAASAIAPLFVSMLVMAIEFQHWYGSPLPNAQYNLPGTLPHTLSASWTTLAGGFWGAQAGWLPFAPVCILALASVGYALRRYRVWVLFGLVAAGLYILSATISGVTIGFSFPGRYEVVLVPFSAFPLLIAAADLARIRWLFWPLAAITLYLTLAVVFEPPPSVAGVPGVTGTGYPQLLWPWFVNIWPQVIPSPAHLYPDAIPVFAWSAGLLVAAVAGFFAVPRARKAARDAAPALGPPAVR